MRKRIFILLPIAGIILILVGVWAFKTNYGTPAKYAIKEGDFDNYAPYIIVQEVHYTGTFWAQVGDESGYFSPESYLDIDLVNGDILPQMRRYNSKYVNKFLCKVDYLGKIEHPAYEDEIDSYYITEWYPVYPVLRDNLFPYWMYPEKYLTEDELGVY